MIMLVPDDIADLPRRRQAADLVGTLKQRDIGSRLEPARNASVIPRKPEPTMAMFWVITEYLPQRTQRKMRSAA